MHFWGDHEFDRGRIREARADGGIREVELVAENKGHGVVVEAVRGCAVHHAVLADEARGAIVVDNKLHRFVIPAILTVAMPILVSAFLERDGASVIETDDERRGFDGLEGGGVGRIGFEQVFACLPAVSCASKGSDLQNLLYTTHLVAQQ